MMDMTQHLKVKADSSSLAIMLEKTSAFCVNASITGLAGTFKTLNFVFVRPSTDSIEPVKDSSLRLPKTKELSQTSIGSLVLASPNDWGKIEVKAEKYIGWRMRLQKLGSPEKVELEIPRTGMVSLDSLWIGDWRAIAYQDINHDGHWSAGKLYPWQEQEKSVNLSDTIKVVTGKVSGPYRFE
jgi:hypothetical protein